jgi:putative glutamine amidotransferase
MKPVIGITPSPVRQTSAAGNLERYAIATCYVNAVLAAGGVPIVLPPQDDNVGAILGLVDGLLFSGGADIDPTRYGDTDVHPKTYDIHPLRDRFEIELIREAIDRDVPLFCICRGIQVLNVACGGSLYQDIPDQFDAAISHRQQEIGLEHHESSHDVTAESDSLLAATYESTAIPVNSYHHQGIKDLAPALRVAGRAEDGLVEAVELPGKRFVLGVQWHPEMMFHEHSDHLAPFKYLVEAASARRLTGAHS